jgi:AcrR family transcriptional regulator
VRQRQAEESRRRI